MISQAVADLCWAVNSPSLVDGLHVMPPAVVEADSVDAEHLEHFLSEQHASYRVGRYFESLIEYWLGHIRKHEITARGLQLRDGKITVGELDFLYRDEAGVLVHCEAAVKFFLCVPGHTPSEFPGPNANDNLEAKITKLFDTQLTRSAEHVPDVGKRLGLMKGMLFSRNGDDDVAAPQRLSPAHLRGSWVRLDEIDSLPGDRFAIAGKPHWLAPQVDADVLPKDDLARYLQAHFDQTDQPVMISSRSAGDEAVEVDRLFVVSATWPDRA